MKTQNSVFQKKKMYLYIQICHMEWVGAKELALFSFHNFLIGGDFFIDIIDYRWFFLNQEFHCWTLIFKIYGEIMQGGGFNKSKYH